MSVFDQLVRDAGGTGRIELTEEERPRWLVAHPEARTAPRTQTFWNEWPPNTVQIDPEDWAFRYHGTWTHVENRQPRFGSQVIGPMHLMWGHDGTGLMHGRIYMASMAPPPIYVDPELVVMSTSPWRSGQAATFWSFAVCLHDWSERLIARALRRYTCGTCGYTKEVDSSD